MLDHHRAFIDAGAAAGAGPEGLGLDHAAPIAGPQDRDAKALADPGRMGRALVALRRRARQGCDQILDQRLGIERLARRIGRADGFAAAALDAGIEADQPVPGEIADRPGAEPWCREIQRRQIGDGTRRAETGGAGMDDQMQGPGDHMLQRTAGDLRGQSQKERGRSGSGPAARRPALRAGGPSRRRRWGRRPGERSAAGRAAPGNARRRAAAASADSAGGRPAAILR